METPPNAPVDRLLAWLRSRGARFPGCTPAVIPGMGMGLLASHELAFEDPILFIPRDLWLTRKTAHTTWTDVLEWAHAVDLFSHGMSRLALLLLLERNTPDSFFGIYLEALGAPTMPLALTTGDREALQCSDIVQWADEQAETTRSECQRLGKELSAAFPGRVDQRWFTLEAWQWAYGHTVQRSFSVDIEAEEVWVLVPGMDLMNHDATVPNGYYTEADGWYVEARQGWETGDQITINYGAKKNSADLLLYYGFVSPDNPNDRIDLQLVLDPNDPDHADKQSLLEALGLRDTCRVGRSGVLPAAFRNAAVLWQLPTRDFRNAQPDFTDPQHESAALACLAQGIRRALDALPSPLAADVKAQASGSPIPAWILAYRIAFKQVMESAAAQLLAQADALRTGAARPNDPKPKGDEGRYALTTVRIHIGA